MNQHTETLINEFLLSEIDEQNENGGRIYAINLASDKIIRRDALLEFLLNTFVDDKEL